ncbi:MAG: hypothetical protein ACI8P9_001506, partial [Parasphingorhabdus sp.]
MNVSKKFIGIIATALVVVVNSSAWAEDLSLPVRNSPIPLTTNSVPHVQIDVEAAPELTA